MEKNSVNPFLVHNIVKNIGKICTLNDKPVIRNLRQTSFVCYKFLNPTYLNLVKKSTRIQIPIPMFSEVICSCSEDSRSICLIDENNDEPAQCDSRNLQCDCDNNYVCVMCESWDPTTTYKCRKLKLDYFENFRGRNVKNCGLTMLELLTSLYPFIEKLMLVNLLWGNRGDEVLPKFLDKFEVLRKLVIEMSPSWYQADLDSLIDEVNELNFKGKIQFRVTSVEALKLIIRGRMAIRRPYSIALHMAFNSLIRMQTLVKLLSDNTSIPRISNMFLHLYPGCRNLDRTIDILKPLSPYLTQLKVDGDFADILKEVTLPNLTHLTVKSFLPVLTNFPRIEYLYVNVLSSDSHKLIHKGESSDEENIKMIFGGCWTLIEIKFYTRPRSLKPFLIRVKRLNNYLQKLLPNALILSEEKFFL